MDLTTLSAAIREHLSRDDTHVTRYVSAVHSYPVNVGIDEYGNRTYETTKGHYVKMNLEISTTTEAINELQKLYKEPKMNKIQTQAAALQAVKQHDIIIGSFDSNGFFSAAQNPSPHPTVVEARTECKRLARLTPGKAFVFLTLSGAEMVPVQTISI